jgi:transposase-like protein
MHRPSRYSQSFREQALQRACQRGERTLDEVAAELSVNVGTLKSWMKHARKTTASPRLAATDRPIAERFELLVQSASLQGEALSAFCRERGLFVHQLQAWRREFTTPVDRPDAELKSRCDALTRERDALQREIVRKDKALAEAAALLVLSKKVQALWGDAVE